MAAAGAAVAGGCWVHREPHFQVCGMVAEGGAPAVWALHGAELCALLAGASPGGGGGAALPAGLARGWRRIVQRGRSGRMRRRAGRLLDCRCCWLAASTIRGSLHVGWRLLLARSTLPHSDVRSGGGDVPSQTASPWLGPVSAARASHRPTAPVSCCCCGSRPRSGAPGRDWSFRESRKRALAAIRRGCRGMCQRIRPSAADVAHTRSCTEAPRSAA